MWSLSRKHTRSAADAEDAAQEIFLDLWRSAARFDPQRSSEVAFVAMIARRRLIDLGRRRARRGEELVEATLSRTPLAETSTVARDALSRLDARERDVLVLATFEGLTQEEIAREKGLPVGTVKSIARRGLLRLRALLSGAGDGAESRDAEVES